MTQTTRGWPRTRAETLEGARRGSLMERTIDTKIMGPIKTYPGTFLKDPVKNQEEFRKRMARKDRENRLKKFPHAYVLDKRVKLNAEPNPRTVIPESIPKLSARMVIRGASIALRVNPLMSTALEIILDLHKQFPRVSTVAATEPSWLGNWVNQCEQSGAITGNAARSANYGDICGLSPGINNDNIQIGDTILDANTDFHEMFMTLPLPIVRTVWHRAAGSGDFLVTAMPIRTGDLIKKTIMANEKGMPNDYPDLLPPGVNLNPTPSIKPAEKVDPEVRPRQGHSREPVQRKPGPQTKPFERRAIVDTVVFTKMKNGETIITTKHDLKGKHKLLPPGRDTKEVKILNWLMTLFIKFGMMPTEWLDFVDAFYSALPKTIRSQKRYHGEPMKRVRALYENIDKIDKQKALVAWWQNELEDRIIGRIIGTLDKYGAANDLRGYYMSKGKLTLARHAVNPESVQQTLTR